MQHSLALELDALAEPEAPAAPTPREKLAAAVRAHEAHQATLAALAGAASAAEDAWRQAREEATAAAEGPARARQAAAEHFVALAKGEDPDPPPSIQTAQAAIVDAEERVVAAVATRDEVARQLRGEQDRAGLRRVLVEDAASAVLAEEAAQVAVALVDEVEGLQRALLDRSHLLGWLRRQGLGVARSGASMAEIASRVEQRPALWPVPEASPASSPSLQRWQATFLALKTDSTALLPTD